MAIGQNDLTDFYDIQAAKAGSFGLPGVSGDEPGGAAHLSRGDMQQIQGPAARGGRHAGNQAHCREENASKIQFQPLEAFPG